MAILHEDRVPECAMGNVILAFRLKYAAGKALMRGARDSKCGWTGRVLENLSLRILNEVPGVVSVTYNIAPKPPSTMEASNKPRKINRLFLRRAC